VRKLVVLAAVLVTALPASAYTTRILAPLDWWPVWSPGGSHVAFTRVYPNHMELYTLDLRTQRSVRIGSNAGQLAPTWSSDGAHLAYSSGGVLWIANANGSSKRRYLAPTGAFAPAWRPGSVQLAYLTTKGATNTDLWVAASLWAPNAIGTPAWSPDGQELAFQRDDGIYLVNGPASERRLVAVANPGAPAWSHDGARLAYTASGRLFVVSLPGGTPTRVITPPTTGAPSFSFDDARIAVATERGIFDGGPPSALGGPGVSWSPKAEVLIASGARPACPGHVVLRESDASAALTGSCTIAGTPQADVIEGTSSWGDRIFAGAGNDRIHANDGHTDRVDCGPGRDTVWADRTDRLTRCEIVHR
jgi:Tol biopolymer transport system component